MDGCMVYAFFAAHWVLCVFFQSLFQHRYAAHRMFTMGPRTERAMHLLTYLVQGASFLSPRGYAILHREHHAFSDTEKDPHAPSFHPNALRMMLHTKKRYDDYAYDRKQPEPRFLGGYPEWPLVDRTLGQSWVMRLAWGALYTAFYVAFATSPWQFLLLPIHFVMGPVHGAIVNWCGHKYGYRNFSNGDDSRNTLPVDILCMGELFQNNHHKYGMSPDFAARRWELDPTWQVMRVLARLGVIHIATPQRAVYPEPERLGETT
ncbi:acyl-CoA desaturase [Archangium violaceum]|uniref:acyl-CoA desaturase n=1 Tax=Archangium violaceum TaxID=83451 RepID=UPI001EF007A2|nr:acyl-CoA desaturase [Archangium violaceum]